MKSLCLCWETDSDEKPYLVIFKGLNLTIMPKAKFREPSLTDRLKNSVVENGSR